MSRSLCERVVSDIAGLSRADAFSVSIAGTETMHLRFARNSVTTSGTARDAELSVTSTFGTRSGSASVNQLDAASLVAVVRRSEAIAELAPEDPEYVEPLGPQDYLPVQSWFAEDAATRMRGMADGADRCIHEAGEAGLVAAGFIRSDEGYRCLATSRGLFGYHTSTSAGFTETVRTKDGSGSGWASRAAQRVTSLDFAGASRAAVDKARGSAAPRFLEPGSYPTVLEPACVAEMLWILVRALDAREADEGRSFFSAEGGGTRLGEALFDPALRVYSDPQHDVVPVVPWGEDGVPRVQTDWIRGGAVRRLACGRYWAATHAHPAEPSAGNVILPGGTKSVDELVGSLERGLLVTSLWYIRSVDPRTLLHTGLTRDGVFWVEDGRIAHPVNNFRWNESPVRMLRNAVELGRPVSVAGRGSRVSDAYVPALRLAEFAFSSVSEAV